MITELSKDMIGDLNVQNPTFQEHGVGDLLKNIILELNKAHLAIKGDMVLSATPATLGSSAAAVNAAIGGAGAKFTRNIVLNLKSVDGKLHDWYQGKMNIAATKSSTSGVVAIAGSLSQATFVNGVATITLEYTGTWATADTCTLTVTGGNLLGYAITNKTSVDTLVA